MLGFASLVLFLGLVHIAIGRARLYISTIFVINPETIEVFQLKRYLEIYSLATRFNRGFEDPEIKACVKEKQRF